MVECEKFRAQNLSVLTLVPTPLMSPHVFAVLEGSLQISDGDVSVTSDKWLTSLSFTLLSKMEIVGFKSIG